MLKLNNIEVSYLNVVKVLHGISISVDDGLVVALLGANGAGKTTTLKAISGLLRIEEGEINDGTIEWDGQRIDRQNAVEIGKLGIVQALEGRRVFGHLTAEENLLVGAFSREHAREVKADLGMVYSYFPRLGSLKNNTAGYLSGGEQQMLVIGRAMMAAPHLMMLDEPSLGLAPIMVKEIFKAIDKINKDGTTVFLVEQDVQVSLAMSHRGYVLENGAIVMEGKGIDLLQDPHIKDVYLGM
jgi:branched-chain amino acid transport system ATP-binding protein